MRRGATTIVESLLRLQRVAGAYWTEREGRRSRRLALTLVIVTLGYGLLQLRVNVWLGDFFDSLDARAGQTLIVDVVVFCLIAVGLMTIAASQIYVKAALQIGWREWITRRFVDRCAACGDPFALETAAVDNPDHRIAEDVRMVTEAAVDFAAGLINSLLLFVLFIGVLWSLSGIVYLPLLDLDLRIPGYLVGAALAYAALTTGVTQLIGHRLVDLSERRHAREGDLRFGLLRLREAVPAGPDRLMAQRNKLERTLARLVKAFMRQMGVEVRITWITAGFSLINPVVPMLIAAPQYYAGRITLGELMQISQAFVQVQLALGFFVDNYMRLSDWLAGINRIIELDAALSAAPAHVPAERSTSGPLTQVKAVLSTTGDPRTNV